MIDCWKTVIGCERRFVAGFASLIFSTALRPQVFLFKPHRISSPSKSLCCPALIPDGAIQPTRRYYSVLNSHISTIYALSTAPGRAAIAIIRVSGPACLAVYQALCPNRPLPKPRYATLRTLHEPHSHSLESQVLDAGALVFYFPAPETATGENILELHVHGGPAVVKAVLSAIPRSVPNNTRTQEIRYAEPGEFTKRAFYNNRLDLTQVEALGDTLSAETEQQRRLAIKGSSSTLAKRYEDWRHTLLYARGELEALIDFSEDQHFDESPAKLCASVTRQVQQLHNHLRASIESASRGELLRNGINIALLGAPNAGKSSLLNHIVGREAAIVSEQAGTTRDIVDVSVDIGGYLCRFGDLAGLRGKDEDASQDLGSIEMEGMRRARERALKADVVIVFLSVRAPSNSGSIGQNDVYLGSEVEATLADLDINAQKVVCILNKADLFPDNRTIDAACSHFTQHPALQRFIKASKIPIIPLSCKPPTTNSSKNAAANGIETFLNHLTTLFASMTSPILPHSPTGVPATDSTWTESLGATERQRILLQQCLDHLEDFLIEVNAGTSPVSNHQISDPIFDHSNNVLPSTKPTEREAEEDDIDIVLAAEHLRSAASCLAKITGKGEMAGDVEDVLGVVFEKFCVGK